MLLMAIERFKNQDAKAIYRRLRDEGRGQPDGLNYVGSWIEADFGRCFQLMGVRRCAAPAAVGGALD